MRRWFVKKKKSQTEDNYSDNSATHVELSLSFIFSFIFSCLVFHLLSRLLFSLSLFLCLLSPSSFHISVCCCGVLLCVVVSCVLCLVWWCETLRNPSAWIQKRLCVYIQNVPVCTSTTRTHVLTCARGASIHGDVLNVHTEAFLNGRHSTTTTHTTTTTNNTTAHQNFPT